MDIEPISVSITDEVFNISLGENPIYVNISEDVMNININDNPIDVRIENEILETNIVVDSLDIKIDSITEICPKKWIDYITGYITPPSKINTPDSFSGELYLYSYG